jgi:hypothetical protein
MGFHLSRARPSETDGEQPVDVTGPGDIFTGPVEGLSSIRIQTTGSTGDSIALLGSLDNINFLPIQDISGPGSFLASVLGYRFIKLTVTSFANPFQVFWNDEEEEVPDQDNEAEYEAGIRPPRFDRVVLTRDSLSKDLTVVNFYKKGLSIKQLQLSYDIDGDLVEVETL